MKSSPCCPWHQLWLWCCPPESSCRLPRTWQTFAKIKGTWNLKRDAYPLHRPLSLAHHKLFSKVLWRCKSLSKQSTIDLSPLSNQIRWWRWVTLVDFHPDPASSFPVLEQTTTPAGGNQTSKWCGFHGGSVYWNQCDLSYDTGSYRNDTADPNHFFHNIFLSYCHCTFCLSLSRPRCGATHWSLFHILCLGRSSKMPKKKLITLMNCLQKCPNSTQPLNIARMTLWVIWVHIGPCMLKMCHVTLSKSPNSIIHDSWGSWHTSLLLFLHLALTFAVSASNNLQIIIVKHVCTLDSYWYQMGLANLFMSFVLTVKVRHLQTAIWSVFGGFEDSERCFKNVSTLSKIQHTPSPDNCQPL